MRQIRKISVKHGCEPENCPIQVWSTRDTENVSQSKARFLPGSLLSIPTERGFSLLQENGGSVPQAFLNISLCVSEIQGGFHRLHRPSFFAVLYSRRFGVTICRFFR
jgi:hypothetical protein